jgi:hypothetical protein
MRSLQMRSLATRFLVTRFFLACGVTLVAAVVALMLQDLTATARPQAERTLVNRTLKGDRLQVLPPGTRNRPAELDGRRTPAAASPRLPDGCESVVSTIGSSSLSRIAGRCVS